MIIILNAHKIKRLVRMAYPTVPETVWLIDSLEMQVDSMDSVSEEF